MSSIQKELEPSIPAEMNKPHEVNFHTTDFKPEFSGYNLDIALVVYDHIKCRCVGRRLDRCTCKWLEARRLSMVSSSAFFSSQFHISILRH